MKKKIICLVLVGVFLLTGCVDTTVTIYEKTGIIQDVAYRPKSGGGWGSRSVREMVTILFEDGEGVNIYHPSDDYSILYVKLLAENNKGNEVYIEYDEYGEMIDFEVK